MEKGLLMLTLAIGCVWLILDDFFGTKRLTSLVLSVTPNVTSPLDNVKEKVDAYKDKVEKNTDEYLNDRPDSLYGQFKEQQKYRYEGLY